MLVAAASQTDCLVRRPHRHCKVHECCMLSSLIGQKLGYAGTLGSFSNRTPTNNFVAHHIHLCLQANMSDESQLAPHLKRNDMTAMAVATARCSHMLVLFCSVQTPSGASHAFLTHLKCVQ